jgi:aspartyl-tRNA(Asn)/glutamyl-tRNA(Gln) amidotransferase subunit A
MPALSMRFGTSHVGLPIGVQIVSSWLAESTVLKVASLLEEASPVRNLHPALSDRRAAASKSALVALVG